MEEVKNTIPLASSVEIPDAILGKDHNGSFRVYKITQVKSNLFDYQANTETGNFYFGFDSTTGAWLDNHNSLATKEFDNIQGYISNGRALYYGGGTSAGATSFTELTDTPSTLDAGSYLRVNSAGDGVEQIKVAPPDGGLGGNSEMQSRVTFDGKLPDEIILTNSNNIPLPFQLSFIDDNNGRIAYYDKRADGKRYVFNLDGSHNTDTNGTNTTYVPFEGSTASLQDIIDGGHAVFHGQKSGTSGVGSLSVMKAKSEEFYTELPDAIVATTNNGFEAVLRLKFANTITNRTNGENFWYEARVDTTAGVTGLSGITSDYIMIFKDDTDGTFMGHSGQTDQMASDGSMDQNLRWFIENGRAIYNGGYNESNTVSARIVGSTGAVASSNYDWIESITRHSAGTYTINFKDGHFTSIPTITFGNDYPSGGKHCIVQYDNLSTSSMGVYVRTVEGHTHIDADFSIMAQHQDRPIALAAPQYGIKAWGTFDGTGSGNLSFTGGNVASVTKISTGVYKVTFANPAPHADYSISGSANPNGYSGAYFGARDLGNLVTTTDFHIELRSTSNNHQDSNRISFQVVY